MGPIPSLFTFNQAVFAQDLEVLRNGRFGYSQMLGKRAHTKVMTQKKVHDLEAICITQYFEFQFQIFHSGL